jgi:cephalosporin-C deacetylase-like acetyl esterase
MKFWLLVAFSLVGASALFFPCAARAQSSKPSGVDEDLSSASIASSHLQSDPAELEERTEEADYVREWVSVRWRPNDPIYLYVVRPRNVQKPPVVIYLYGYPSETDIFHDDDWCERTTSGGYAAVGFVAALNGHRYHDRPMKQWFVSEMQESLAKSSHDVQMVLNYLAQRGDLNMEHVGMFGVGAGATIAVMAASADSRIKAVDLVDPWGDWPVWMAKSEVVPDEERPGYVKPEFLKKIAGFDPVALLPQLKTLHVRLTELSDSAMPKESRQAIAAALSSRAERGPQTSEAQFDVMGAINGGAFDWLKEQLKPATAPGVKAATKPAASSSVKN